MIKPFFKFKQFYKYKKYVKTEKKFKYTGNLLLFKRHSNIFLVLLNNKNRHLITLTAGNCLLGNRKKDKMAVHNMPKMINKLLLYMNRFKIKFINIFIRQRVSGHFFNLQKLLRKNNITLLRFKFILKRPHGFLRGRKLRCI